MSSEAEDDPQEAFLVASAMMGVSFVLEGLLQLLLIPFVVMDPLWLKWKGQLILFVEGQQDSSSLAVSSPS